MAWLGMIVAFGFLATGQWYSREVRLAQEVVEELNARIENQFSQLLNDPKPANYDAVNSTMKAREAANAERDAKRQTVEFFDSAAAASLFLFWGILQSVARWWQSQKADRRRTMLHATMLTLACAVVALFPLFRGGFHLVPHVYSKLGVPGLLQQAIDGRVLPTVAGWLSVAATFWILAFANLPAGEKS